MSELMHIRELEPANDDLNYKVCTEVFNQIRYTLVSGYVLSTIDSQIYDDLWVQLKNQIRHRISDELHIQNS